MLLFGRMAMDDEMGQVGTLAAELLNLPLVTSAAQIEVAHPGRASVQRALDRGNREVVESPLPAVFTVDKTLNRPRYPTWPDRKKASASVIERIDIPSAPSVPEGVEMVLHRLAPPKPRPKKILAPDGNMSDAESMKFVMTGGMGAKKGGAVAGDPKQTASSIMEFLKEKGLI